MRKYNFVKHLFLLVCLFDFFIVHAYASTAIDSVLKEQIIKVGQQKLNALILQNEQFLKEGKTDKLNFVVSVNPEDYIIEEPLDNKPNYLSSSSIETGLNGRLNQISNIYSISCYFILINYFDVKITAKMPDNYTLNELFNTSKFFQENTNIQDLEVLHKSISAGIVNTVINTSQNYFVFTMANYYAAEFQNTSRYYSLYYTDTIKKVGASNSNNFKNTFSYFKTHLKNNSDFRSVTLNDLRVDKAVYSLEMAAKNAPLKGQILITYSTSGLKSILDNFTNSSDYSTLTVAERIHVLSVMLNDIVFGSIFTAEEIYALNVIKTTPPNDVNALLISLEKPSPLNSNINYTGSKTNTDALIYRLVGAIDDGTGTNYSDLMSELNTLISNSPEYNSWCAEMMADDEFDKRIMNWGEGTDNYIKIGDVSFNSNGNITVTKQDLEVSCDTINKNTFNQEISCYGNWVSSPATVISPFKLVMFTNFSNISAIDGATQSTKGTAKIVPAIYLKYSKDKETNYKIEKGISYTIDGLSLISGGGILLNGGFKALNWGRKAWIIYNTSVATANIIINASDIPNDPDFQDAYQAYTAITIASGVGELSYNGIKNFSSCVRTTKNIANNVTQVTKQQYLALIVKLDAVYAKLQSGALVLNVNGLKAYKKLKAYTDRLKQNWQKLFKEPLPSATIQGAGNMLEEIISTIPASTRNQFHINEGRLAPYDEAFDVALVKLNPAEEYVRVFKKSIDANGVPISNKESYWFMRKKDILNSNGSLLTPSQIKNKFALPELPTHFTKIQPPTNTQVYRGFAKEQIQLGWGNGGGIQFEFNQQLQGSWFVGEFSF